METITTHHTYTSFVRVDVFFLQLVGAKQTEFQVNSMQLLYYQVYTYMRVCMRFHRFPLKIYLLVAGSSVISHVAACGSIF